MKKNTVEGGVLLKKIDQEELLTVDALSQRLEGFNYSVLAFGHWEEGGVVRSKCDVLSSFKLAIITAGHCRVASADREFSAGQGDVFLFAPFVRNSVACVGEERVGLYYIYFDLLPLQKRGDFTRLFHLRSLEHYPGRVGELVLPQLKRVERAVFEEQPGCYYRAKLALQRTLVDLLLAEQERGHPYLPYTAGVEERVVEQCVEYLDAHWAENVQVSHLCEKLSLSQSYLSRCFTRVMGRSTKEFIVVHKLHQAERALAPGSAPMEEVAVQYGFPSAHAFRTAFKKYYGVSPTTYRKETKG